MASIRRARVEGLGFGVLGFRVTSLGFGVVGAIGCRTWALEASAKFGALKGRGLLRNQGFGLQVDNQKTLNRKFD